MLEHTDEIILETAQRLNYSVKQFHPDVPSFFITDPDSNKSFVASHWSIYPCQKQWHASLMRYKDLCSTFLDTKGFKTITGIYIHNTGSITATELEETLRSSIARFCGFPCVIKQNDGSQSRNIFICNSASDLKRYMDEIHQNITHILVQPYVEQREFRLFLYKGEIKFLYEKQFVPFSEINNRTEQSPLSKKTLVLENFPEYLEIFATRLYSAMDADVIGVDVFVANEINEKQDVTIIELNHNPGLSVLYHTYDEKRFVISLLADIYEDYITL